jgi:hypothetical protein
LGGGTCGVYPWSFVPAESVGLPSSTRIARNRVSRTPGFSTILTWTASFLISGPARSNCSKTTSSCPVLLTDLLRSGQLCYFLLQPVPRPRRPVLSTFRAPPGGHHLDAPGEQEQRQGALYPLLSLVPGVDATPLAFDDARLRSLFWHVGIVARLGGGANFGPKSGAFHSWGENWFVSARALYKCSQSQLAGTEMRLSSFGCAKTALFFAGSLLCQLHWPPN